MTKSHSTTITLSHAERKWLPWFGTDSEPAFSWFYFLNRHTYPVIEQTVENVTAHVKILKLWTHNQCGYLYMREKSLRNNAPSIGCNRLVARIAEITEVIRTIAETNGNLRQRLDTTRLSTDETGDVDRWVNSFIDNLDGIISQAIHVVHDVNRTNKTMLNRNQDADETAQEVADTIRAMLAPLQNQISEIRQAADTAEDMRQVMENVVSNAKLQPQTTRGEPQSVCNTIDTSIHTPDQRADKIGDMIEESLRLTEDTAFDNNHPHNIASRLQAAIQQIAQHNKHHDTSAINVATGAKNLRHSIDEPQQMADTVHVTIDEIGRLLGQFQVSACG